MLWCEHGEWHDLKENIHNTCNNPSLYSLHAYRKRSLDTSLPAVDELDVGEENRWYGGLVTSAASEEKDDDGSRRWPRNLCITGPSAGQGQICMVTSEHLQHSWRNIKRIDVCAVLVTCAALSEGRGESMGVWWPRKLCSAGGRVGRGQTLVVTSYPMRCCCWWWKHKLLMQ